MRLKLVAAICLGLVIIAPRVFDLGTIYTIDERLWLERGEEFMEGLRTFDLDKTAVSYHPGVTTAWLAGITSRFDSLAAAQGAVAATTGILLIAAAYFLVRLFGWGWGMAAAYVVALNPVLLAHSRVIHTDALLALFLLTSMLALAMALKDGIPAQLEKRYLIISGVLAGLAVLTKLFALFAIAPLLFFLVWKLRRKAGYWIGAGLAAVLILWPALWVSPFETTAYVWENIMQFSSGRRTGEVSTLWWFYLREMFARTTPIATLLFPLGIIGWFFEKKRNVRRALVLLLAASAVYVLLLHTGQDRDARYLLIFYLVADIWAVFGIRFVSSLFRAASAQRAAAVFLAAAAVIYLGGYAWQLHPYYLAHYNKLYPVPETFKIGWGEGLEQAAKYLAKKDPDAEVASFYGPVFEYFWIQSGGTGSAVGHDWLSESTDYLVIPRAMFERAPDSIASQQVQEYIFSGQREPELVIRINGLDYVWIFQLAS